MEAIGGGGGLLLAPQWSEVSGLNCQVQTPGRRRCIVMEIGGPSSLAREPYVEKSTATERRREEMWTSRGL
jgi:hypothetical protein